MKARIIGTGSYLPKTILSNFDLEKMVETSDEWIFTRTGIRERRIAAEGEFTSHMGTKAAEVALKTAGLSADEIDFIIVATITPDYPFPSTACLIQEQLQAKRAAGVDIQAACTGYLYALSFAKALVEMGAYRNILVIASEKLSSITDYKDRSTCILFGDGASAAIVSARGPGLWMRSVELGADGEQGHLLMMPGGGCRRPASVESIANREHFVKMAGNEVFKHAVRRMESACKDCLDAAKVEESEVSWIVPHQANSRILEALAKRFSLPNDRVYMTLQKYGNTSASSVGIALHELLEEGKVQEGEKLLLTAFGGGFTWGAVLVEQESS